MSGRVTIEGSPRRRGLTGTAPEGILKPVPSDLFVDHRVDGDPEHNVETRWSAVREEDYLTPVDRFFVRSHDATPLIDVDAWRLTIDGDGVDRAVHLGYDELAALADTRLVRALECAGNGRVPMGEAHGKMPEGAPWGTGAIGVAAWQGVPLVRLLSRAGVRADAVEVVPEGLDGPRVRRPIPIEHALRDDVLVALAMNGEPLPADHGFPARLLVPGWAAIASVKWLGRLEVTTAPVRTIWNTDTYVLRGDAYDRPEAPGGEVVTRQVPKAVFALDAGATVAAGSVRLVGRAWSPDTTVVRVEVSVDGGSWHEVPLHEPNEAGAWVRWSFVWSATPGRHVLRARATDGEGRIQPDVATWNDGGYLNGGVIAQTIDVVGGESS